MTGNSQQGPRLGVLEKLALGAGDHSLTLALSTLSFVYLFFLTNVVGLRPALAGGVLWVGRVIDALTDPLMGRISDATRSRLGRRRPYFLIGALPFGASFALLWFVPELESQAARFAWCVVAYVLYDLASTTLAVPYVAVLPETVPDYSERNSVNAYRSALVLLATLLAAGTFQPLARWLGDGRPDFLAAGLVFGAWLVLPWFALVRVVRERPEYQRPLALGFVAGLRALLAHRNYLHLAGLYVAARIAMDLSAMMLLFWFADWLGRPSDFEPTLLAFMLSAVFFLPFWVRLAERREKRRIFQWACAWWAVFMGVLGFASPEFPPRWAIFALVALAGASYAVIEMMPWSMLGEVVDEDEWRSGERREGVYGGVLTWVRKLAGATAVALGGIVLEWTGYRGGAEQQGETARHAIRWLASLGPALFLLLAIAASRGYSLTRERHREIRRALDARA
jgi:sugar (glycoside-pentoside-hexuronide) transporter